MLHKTVSFVHKLRVYFLVIIIIGFFVVAGLNPVDIGVFLGAKVGSAIGMSTKIVENPFNKLALDLKSKEEKLNLKEKELDAREYNLSDAPQSNQVLLRGLIAGIFALFALVLINFIFDYKRGNNEKK